MFMMWLQEVEVGDKDDVYDERKLGQLVLEK